MCEIEVFHCVKELFRKQPTTPSFRKIAPSWMFDRGLNTPLTSLFCLLYFVGHCYPWSSESSFSKEFHSTPFGSTCSLYENYSIKFTVNQVRKLIKLESFTLQENWSILNLLLTKRKKKLKCHREKYLPMMKM